MSIPGNAAQAFDRFKVHVKASEYLKVKTALLRFTVPGWSGIYPLEKRFSVQAIASAFKVLEGISLQQLQEALSIQAQVFEYLQVSAGNRRVFKSYLKKFLHWCEAQGWFAVTTLQGNTDHAADGKPAKETIQIYKLKSPKGVRKPTANELHLSGVPKKANYALGTVAGDELKPYLEQQLEQLSQFMQHKLGLRPATRKSYRERLLQLFGWLYREQGVPLEALCLESVIPIVELKVRVTDFMTPSGSPDHNQWAIAKVLAEEAALQSAKQVDQLLRQYTEFLGGSLSSKLKVLQACINTAKYLYNDKTSDPRQYRDIPIILLLRKQMRSLRQTEGKAAPRIAFEAKSLPWTATYQVLLQLKQEADTVVLHQVAPRRTGGIAAFPRKTKGTGRSHMRFLLLAFFVLIPPVRSRTIRELELGRTLVWGGLQDGRVVPPERLPDPAQAQWFIHLKPQDYKTGATYQDYVGAVPNTSFSDGTCLYDYLERWIKVYRPLFQPQHQLLFMKHNGDPLSKDDLNGIVRRFFFKFTGIPVTPKELRPMYVTYLRNQRASEAELDAAARAMQHSRARQNADYDRQQQLDKQAPIHAFNQRLLHRQTQGGL
jgi:hypothetical protein